MKERREKPGGGSLTASIGGATPGKRTLVESSMAQAPVVQRKTEGAAPQAEIAEDEHDHGVEPNPGDGAAGANLDQTRPVGSNIPDDVRTPLMAEVERSPRMQQVLQEITAHGGAAFDIKWSARGGYHGAGVIYIDRRQTMASWISTMMHELNHLNDHRQGLNPSAGTTASRDDFVNTKMRNEIRSHAISYVGLIEVENAQGAIAAAPPAGYTEFRAHLRQREAADQVCYAAAAIQRIAEEWVEAKYRNEWTTSNTGENYYVYWGRAWDEAHPSR